MKNECRMAMSIIIVVPGLGAALMGPGVVQHENPPSWYLITQACVIIMLIALPTAFAQLFRRIVWSKTLIAAQEILADVPEEGAHELVKSAFPARIAQHWEARDDGPASRPDLS